LEIDFGLPHSVPLVGLSVLLGVLGGYLGLGFAAQARDEQGGRRRIMLAAAAWCLGLGIWTMHFVGILAAQFPGPVTFSVLLTMMSFLMCVLVVGIAAFLKTALCHLACCRIHGGRDHVDALSRHACDLRPLQHEP
jgi:NO-binding membrane sensor protein with MHYT domain